MKQYGDEKGLFWECEIKPLQKKVSHENLPRVRPPIPETGWQRPDSLPDLSSARRIAVDVESHDPKLQELGSGVYRGDAHIVGIALGTDNGYRAYFPFDHKDSDNFRKEDIYPWVSQQLSRTTQEKVGANLLYDLDLLQHEGVKVAGKLRDVQLAEPLIDEQRYEYNLEALSQDYLKVGKEQDVMIDWAMRAFGCKDKDVKKFMREIPATLVGPYAESDVDRPLRILPLQEAKLQQEGMEFLFDMECDLLWPLLRMRQTGVRIDAERAHRLHEEFEQSYKKIIQELGGINIDESAALVRLFDKEGIAYPRTEKGNPSFRKTWLEHHSHPMCQKIVEARQYRVLLSTFLKGCLEGHNVNGRIHCQFNPLRGDNYGTVTGRFSSSNPNLQNIPVRTEAGAKIRAMFIPEEGMDWWKRDWSQIEYRLIVHFAAQGGCERAEDAVQRYLQDKTTDFHQLVAELCGIPRKQAKNINFGIAYGQGVDTLADALGVSRDEARKILEYYHADAPFIGELMGDCSRAASKHGFISTLFNRRRRYTKWEAQGVRASSNYKKNKDYIMLDKDAAISKWGADAIQRAKAYTAMNAKIQGSAADIMKKAMVDIWNAGLFEELPIHLTVHDELDGSVPRTEAGQKALKELHYIMENCVKLRVPMLADGGEGANWGSIK